MGTKCTSCNSNKYLSGSSCLSLPAGVFLWKQDSITRNCFPTCSACESSEITKCTQCYSDYIPVLTTDTVKGNLNIFSCDSKCPVTHYITSIYQSVAGTYCLPCETLVTNCIKCQQDSPTSKAICQKCISGFYVNVDVNTLFNNICTKCDATCAECAGTPTNCIACASGKVLSYDSGASTYSCVTDPATLAATNRICPHEKYLYKGQCYEKDCPDGSFRRKYYTDDCASCEVATPGCFSCNKATGVCEVCKPEYKKDVTNTCFLCDQNSLQCCKVGQGTTSGTCSVCTDLNAADCFTPIKSTVCNTGFVLNSVGVCKATITNCNSYNYAASTCLLCSGSKVQSAATCVTSCTAPKLSYITNSRIICQGCNSNCNTCTYPDTNNRCSACTSANGYFQTNLGCSTCYSTVIYFDLGNLQCIYRVHLYHMSRWLPGLRGLLLQLSIRNIPQRRSVLKLRRLRQLHRHSHRQLQLA